MSRSFRRPPPPSKAEAGGLMSISELCIRRPVFATVLSLIILLIGIVAKVEADAQAIIYITFRSDRLNAIELTDYVDRYVVNRFKNLTGISDAAIYGERLYAMRIWLDRDRLAGYGLTAQDIEDALRQQNAEIPAGRIESDDREFTVLSKTALSTPEEFRNIMLKRAGGLQVKLGDVARVELSSTEVR